ncbi:uncharacterized protein BKA55DRAFT_378230 [Fusarium redolens]|uniref:Uncharacterized protein n=1 Tax=Fusarium redolens TaxID=48865 RepID=A0A9P9H5W8_FUSRE|nr:uncharacterized protein BKA55DRAFT_378230 [Fusarium redolens]KAH7250372.1 hypothetical protein BKA55DRAFT_378230 [Fusarium redolens]
MRDIRAPLQDERFTCNPNAFIRRSSSFTPIWESSGPLTAGKAQPPSEACFSSTPAVLEPPKSCETVISRSPSDRDSGYGSSPHMRDPFGSLAISIGFDDRTFSSSYPSARSDMNMQLHQLDYSNSSQRHCGPWETPLSINSGHRLSSSLRGYSTRAEPPLVPALQLPTRRHEPLRFREVADMRLVKRVSTTYTGLGRATQNWDSSRYVPLSTMHSDPCSVRETKQGKPAATGIPVGVGESVLDAPNQSLAVNSEDQIVTRPDTDDKLSCVRTCSSSPLTNIPSTHTKQGQSTDELSEGNLKHLGEKKDMIEWIISTKDAAFALSPSLSIHSPPSPSLSVHSPGSSSCSLETIPRDFVLGESLTRSRALIMELFRILSHQDCESSFDEPWLAEGSPMQTTYSSTPLTDGSGTDTSPKSGTTTSASGFERNSKRSQPTRAGSSQEDDGDEPSRKEFRQEKNPSNPEAMASFQGRIQMPCPVHQPQKCQGTNTTISELLRCLRSKHRIVIYTDCCTQVHVPEDERKPDNVRKRHKSETCEPRCIGTTCSGNPNDEIPHHRRTENCPSWQSLPNDTRWSFIWGLINPGENSPDPGFYTGVGYEHNTALRPCKQQFRPRGADIRDALMRDIEERD